MTTQGSPLGPTSHRQVLAQLHLRFEQGVQNGDFVPFTYPMATYGAAVLLLFFMIPPKSICHSLFGRCLAFAFIFNWHVFLIYCTRSHSMAVGFGIGIVSAWGILWSAVLLIFSDAKVDSRKVERVEEFETQRHNVSSERKEEQTMAQLTTARPHEATPSQMVNPKRVTYFWQPYPMAPWGKRLEWNLDLLSNFRGVGWNWVITGLPSRPLEVQEALNNGSDAQGELKDIPASFKGVRRFDTRRELLIHNIWLFTKGYLTLDALKCLINRDPYFWGQIPAATPTHLPTLVQQSSFLLSAYRSLVTMSMVWLGLRTIFCMGTIVFVGVLGPRYLGANGEPWMYPDHYGDNFSNVSRHGLGGWWGRWWHQTFRYSFQAGGLFVVRIFRLEQRRMAARAVQLLVAFALSGLLHASGSITMLGTTAPWRKSFLFFILQPVGILVEIAWRRYLRKAGLLKDMPSWAGRAANIVYAYMWLYLTAPLLAEDFARGGIWLMEPVMLSPLRALGFGVEGDGFFCWGGRVAEWHRSPRWWLSGVEI